MEDNLINTCLETIRAGIASNDVTSQMRGALGLCRALGLIHETHIPDASYTLCAKMHEMGIDAVNVLLRVYSVEFVAQINELSTTVRTICNNVETLSDDVSYTRERSDQILSAQSNSAKDVLELTKRVSSLSESETRRFDSIDNALSLMSGALNDNTELVRHETAAIQVSVASLPPYIDASVKRAYSESVTFIRDALNQVSALITSLGNAALDNLESNVAYQKLIVDTRSAVDKLADISVFFRDYMMSAERYLATLSDCISIQQLQKSIVDSSERLIGQVTQLSRDWASDRAKLYAATESISATNRADFISRAVNDAIRSLCEVASVTQEGIKMVPKKEFF